MLPLPVKMPRRRALGFAACAMAGTLWGTGFYFGKIALMEMSVGHMVFYRFFFACIGLLPITALHPPALNAREWGVLLTASFLGVPLQFLIQFEGLARTTVSHAALMVGTMPVLLAVGATLFAKERMDGIGWIALGCSTCGAALIVLSGRRSASGGGPSLSGDLLVVLSLVIALAWILLNKRLMERHSAIVVTAYGLAAGFLMLCVWVSLEDGLPPIAHISLRAWLALAASGVLCTATTTLLWNYGLTQVPASQAGVFLNIEPMMGSLLGVWLLGDVLGPAAWVGGGMILAAAITLTSRPQSHVEDEHLIA
ncbi:MAG: DMT family transporter [Acidobacteriaceae bacterium]